MMQDPWFHGEAVQYQLVHSHASNSNLYIKLLLRLLIDNNSSKLTVCRCTYYKKFTHEYAIDELRCTAQNQRNTHSSISHITDLVQLYYNIPTNPLAAFSTRKSCCEREEVIFFFLFLTKKSEPQIESAQVDFKMKK